MVQFLSNFFSWISSIFVGFFKISRFFVSLCRMFYIFMRHVAANPTKYSQCERETFLCCKSILDGATISRLNLCFHYRWLRAQSLFRAREPSA